MGRKKLKDSNGVFRCDMDWEFGQMQLYLDHQGRLFNVIKFVQIPRLVRLESD